MRVFTKTVTAAAAILAAVGAAGCSSGSSKTTAPVQLAAATAPSGTTGPSINVAGHGEVEGTPDTMTVTMGVQTNDPSAQAALQHNNERANALVASLRGQGVAPKDIQTVDLNISPTFDKNFHITGYSASNTVTATLRDLSKAGKVIDTAALTVGQDIRFQGVSFSIANTSALVREKARADAVKDAVAQAKQLAAAGGVKVGAIRTIDDTGVLLPQQQQFRVASGQASDVNAVPIEAGSQQLSVDVTVVFDIAT